MNQDKEYTQHNVDAQQYERDKTKGEKELLIVPRPKPFLMSAFGVPNSAFAEEAHVLYKAKAASHLQATK